MKIYISRNNISLKNDLLILYEIHMLIFYIYLSIKASNIILIIFIIGITRNRKLRSTRNILIMNNVIIKRFRFFLTVYLPTVVTLIDFDIFAAMCLKGSWSVICIMKSREAFNNSSNLLLTHSTVVIISYSDC